jgi:hypothetical protein
VVGCLRLSVEPTDSGRRTTDNPPKALVMRTRDDGKRGPIGLCLSLRREGPNVELTMDEVVLHTDADGGTHWHLDRFITFADVAAAQLNGEMSESDYARFGRFVFVSVSAIAKFRLPGNE